MALSRLRPVPPAGSLILAGLLAATLACSGSAPPASDAEAGAADRDAPAPSTSAPRAEGPSTPPPGPAPAGLELLGVVSFPTGFTVGGFEVGGLSGLSCEPATGRCWSISDDRGQSGPPRFFTLAVDLADGSLDPDDVRFTGAVPLSREDGSPFPEGGLDPEGIARDAAGDLWISSEGNAKEGVAPWVRRFSADGSQMAELTLPSGFLPEADVRGVRYNLALECLTLTPDGRHLWTGVENALVQDGPAADLGVSSPSRLLRFDLEAGSPDRQLLYWVDPVDAHRPSVGDFRVSGLVELLALPDGDLLSLERAYVQGLGNRIRLYRLDPESADDLQLLDPDAAGIDPSGPAPVRKRLLADLAQHGIEPDNVEGLSFGPPHPDGRATLLLVSDNNFNPLQETQVIAFALELDALTEPEADPIVGATIAEIQGAGHRSPLEGRRVAEVEGIVTGVVDTPRDAGFWLQSAEDDGDPATSEALFVATGYRAPGVVPGHRVRVAGRVEEHGSEGELPQTRIRMPWIQQVLAEGQPLPEAVSLGGDGRRPPLVNFDDDGLELFEPDTDALDFWESLEGMRVAAHDPVVVGPTMAWGELVVALDGADSANRTARGGLLLTAADAHPERLVVGGGPARIEREAAVGQRFPGGITGILDQGRGGYRLRPDEPLPTPAGEGPAPDSTPLARTPGHLTVATYNLYNLAGSDAEEEFEGHARVIVDHLGSPEMIGLQEVQDANGPVDDGTVDGRPTLDRLVQAIVDAGGPRYDYRQIDPVDNRDGGRPGSNIRVALLFDPASVRFVDRGAAGPDDAVEVTVGDGGPRLTLSPARLEPLHPAFTREPAVDFGGSRKPLVGEVEAGGRRLFVVVAHLASKGGDDRLFGDRQPPVARSEVQRRDQAGVIHAFVARLLLADPEAAVIVLGDLNELPFRPPLERLKEILVDPVATTVPADERYSFVYRGNSQRLDYALLSPALAAGAEADVVHVHADFPAARRASDHDPVVVRIPLP